MIIDENLYQYGNLQEATFGAPFKYGGMNWRYTIPGHGVSDWKIILSVLKDSGYNGCVSIELEDHYYDDTEYDQKQGVLQGVKFLGGVLAVQLQFNTFVRLVRYGWQSANVGELLVAKAHPKPLYGGQCRRSMSKGCVYGPYGLMRTYGLSFRSILLYTHAMDACYSQFSDFGATFILPIALPATALCRRSVSTRPRSVSTRPTRAKTVNTPETRCIYTVSILYRIYRDLQDIEWIFRTLGRVFRAIARH